MAFALTTSFTNNSVRKVIIAAARLQLPSWIAVAEIAREASGPRRWAVWRTLPILVYVKFGS